MNRYTVVYLASAERELVDAWEAAADRQAVASAADKADEILGSTPAQAAVYLQEELWRLEVLPLQFYFSILEDDRIVKVSSVIRLPE